jgi:hypothetical protein
VKRRTFLRTSVAGGLLLGGAAVVGRHLGGYSLAPEVAARLTALSPKEYLILDAVVARVVAADGPEAPGAQAVSATLHVDRYLGQLDDALRADVRALLHLLEHGAGWTRFTHLSPPAQDEVLRAWQTSRLTVRRRGLQALRTLAFFGYWRDDRTWPLLAYSGPMLPRRAR